MCEKLSDYLVLEILTSGNYGEACYKVQQKQTEALLVWKAYNTKNFTQKDLDNISKEVKQISRLKNINLILYHETIVHEISDTIYIVTDFVSSKDNLAILITKCKEESIFFYEKFIWNTLYQLAVACKHLADLKCIEILQKQLKTSNIFVDSESRIKIDPFYLEEKNNDPKKCTNNVCKLGFILYEMCTLNTYKSPLCMDNFISGDDMKNIIKILIHDQNDSCNLKPDVILHHPTVLINLTFGSNEIFASHPAPMSPTNSNDSAFESDESTIRINNCNLRKSLSTENVSSSPLSNKYRNAAIDASSFDNEFDRKSSSTENFNISPVSIKFSNTVRRTPGVNNKISKKPISAVAINFENIPKVENKIMRKSLSSENIPSSPVSVQFDNTPDYACPMENKFIPMNSKFEGLQLSPNLVALDLKMPGYAPKRNSDHLGKWRSRLELCKEPQEVSEQALSHVWLQRLAELRDREEALNAREKEVNKKKAFQAVEYEISSSLKNINNQKVPEKKESKPMSGITLQTVMNQKTLPTKAKVLNVQQRPKSRTSLSDGSVASNGDRKESFSKHSYRRSSSVRTRYKKKQSPSYEDMNSSLSADQGDTSFLPTSKKISAEAVPRPLSLHNPRSKKVHFNARNNPFADYESISSTTLTFFEIENIDSTYEIPKKLPADVENIADRIAKFTYLDLEAMTEQKRALMEEWRKTPPKVNRNVKPTLRSKLKAAEIKKKADCVNLNEEIVTRKNTVTNITNLNKGPTNSSRMRFASSHSGGSFKSVSSASSLIKKDDRRKTIFSTFTEAVKTNSKDDKENELMKTPAPDKLKRDSKRKSILGFKTPFKFRL